MTSETILESKVSGDTPNNKSKEDSVFLKTLRLTLNLLTNILIILTVFVCLLYAWPSRKVNAFQLHIIFCVMGYQFFMCQGTLVLSKFNSWSTHIPKRHRRNIHWILQVLGIIFVIAGSVVMIEEKPVNFNTYHSILGLCALVTSVLGFSNGLLAYYSSKLSSFIAAKWTKLIHYITGIATLLLSAACLCLGFEQTSFKSWAGDDSAIVLEVITTIFTVQVALDFILNTSRRIKICCT